MSEVGALRKSGDGGMVGWWDGGLVGCGELQRGVRAGGMGG